MVLALLYTDSTLLNNLIANICKCGDISASLTYHLDTDLIKQSTINSTIFL